MIIFAHLLNDRTGSPTVLASVISVLNKSEKEVRLFVSNQGKGCLDDLGVKIEKYWYRRARLGLFTFLNLLISQCFLLIKLLRCQDIPINAVVYVNTLLPFGAGLYGYLTGRRVIYHLHEATVTPRLLRWFLVGVANRVADRAIYVSEFHRSALPLKDVICVVIPNALSNSLVAEANLENINISIKKKFFKVLMLSSLRKYKGIDEFLLFAKQFENIKNVCFELVANESQDYIDTFFENIILPKNITIHASTNNPCFFYKRASLVVNLSRIDLCQETFGLTLLEAMAFGLPVIGPPVGGPAEIVRDGIEGYLVDSRDTNMLVNRLCKLISNDELYLLMSNNAKKRSKEFSHYAFSRGIKSLIDQFIR